MSGTLSRSRLAALLLVVALVLGLAGSRLFSGDSDDARSAHGDAQNRRGGGGLADELAAARARDPSIRWTPPPRLDGAVTVAGRVVDLMTRQPVGGVEVVFRSAAGEESTIAGADGSYRIDVAPGAYRAFVRDDSVLSVGYADHVRLPGPPSADAIGLPDEQLMPIVDAHADTDGVDLSVLRGGIVRGRVVDRAGKPIANAVVRPHTSDLRPTLGTDVGETDANGVFELRLPEGGYRLDGAHPRYAGTTEQPIVEVHPGEVATATVTLTAGCVIAGRVLDPAGAAAGDGAIETQWGTTEHEFTPTGRIAADGTFRWFTTEEQEVTLRAWPWKSPPSQPQRFACRDGARYDGVVFRLPSRGPDLDGVLVDHGGAPVALAYIDVLPLDDGGVGQQERTDAEGRWSVFQLPAGRYRVTATAPGRGVVSTIVAVPQTSVHLALAGTGRIDGSAPELATGSLEVRLAACTGDAEIRLPHERRLVAVVDHHFTIPDVPACDLAMVVEWEGKRRQVTASVPAGGVGHLELDLGPAREKTVHGVVRDASGRPVAGARVIAAVEDGEPAVDTTDGAGRYSVRTIAGASVVVHGSDQGVGSGEVTLSKGDDEELDITLEPLDQLE